MKKFFKKALSLVMISAVLLSLMGCAVSPAPIDPGKDPSQGGSNISASLKAVNLMAGFTSRNTAEPVVPADESAVKAADFAVRLFKACAEEGGNTLVSPLSVLAALSMTANGAKGETLREMENVLGMSVDELNEFYYNYAAQLVNSDKYKLDLANSIWFTADDRFTVNNDFLQKNADYFGADAYKAPFDDDTLKDINDWVKQKTDGMIPEILDKIPQSAVMYLINALAFDAEWDSIYKKSEVRNGDFTLEDGTRRAASYLCGDEYTYLNAGNAEGFLKYYSGNKYAFAALLPNEGVSVNELVASLSGEKLMSILNGAKNEAVETMIPKFETGYSVELSDVLKEMGMPRAFEGSTAELTGLGTSAVGNIFISRVLHKTFISVDERGTRAGAVTVVEAVDECAAIDSHVVLLDRPFVYMLIDCETNLPFFIGTMMDINN